MIATKMSRLAMLIGLSLILGCSSAGSGGAPGVGGTTAGSGGAGSGGRQGTGGSSGAGGIQVSGGTSNSGGIVSGGSSGSGGRTSSGGATGSGGSTSTGSFVNPAPGSKFFIGANFWNEGWEPASDFFASNVNWATTTNPWNPTLLSDLAPYAHVLRFMDWNRTNDQVAGSWATRAQPNVAPGDRGVAYEWQIDLCNRAHVDYWINVPTLADDDHVTKLAQLIQQKLDPSLRIYIEYSNEVWNGGFPQATYADNQGVAANMPGMNQSYKGGHGMCSARCRFSRASRVYSARTVPAWSKSSQARPATLAMRPTRHPCAHGICSRSPTRPSTHKAKPSTLTPLRPISAEQLPARCRLTFRPRQPTFRIMRRV